MMYVGITSVVLIFLNLYAATTMRNLVFRSKETSLEDKVQMAASAFSGLRTIQEESAEKIMDQLGNLNATRVLVTDASGLVLYDSLDEDAALGQYAVLPTHRRAVFPQARPILPPAEQGRHLFVCGGEKF